MLRVVAVDKNGEPSLSQQDLDELCGCFRIFKDIDWDRLILNPTVRNSRTRTLSNRTRLLGQGFNLTRLHIPEGSLLRFSATDLREFYSCSVV